VGIPEYIELLRSARPFVEKALTEWRPELSLEVSEQSLEVYVQIALHGDAPQPPADVLPLLRRAYAALDKVAWNMNSASVTFYVGEEMDWTSYTDKMTEVVAKAAKGDGTSLTLLDLYHFYYGHPDADPLILSGLPGPLMNSKEATAWVQANLPEPVANTPEGFRYVKAPPATFVPNAFLVRDGLFYLDGELAIRLPAGTDGKEPDAIPVYYFMLDMAGKRMVTDYDGTIVPIGKADDATLALLRNALSASGDLSRADPYLRVFLLDGKALEVQINGMEFLYYEIVESDGKRSLELYEPYMGD